MTNLEKTIKEAIEDEGSNPAVLAKIVAQIIQPQVDNLEDELKRMRRRLAILHNLSKSR